MTTTQEVADAVIKTLFEGEGAHDQMRNFNPTLKLFEPTTDNIEGGKTINFPLRKQYQQGLGARANGEDLPTPGASNFIACDFPLKKLTFSVQIETAAWKKTKAKGVAAFVDLLSDQGTDVMNGYYRDKNGMLYRDGSGLLTSVNGAITGPDTTIDVIVDSTAYLMEGMLIDIYPSGSDTPLETAIEVVSVDNNTLTINLAAISQTIPDNAEIYRNGNKDNEIMGLGGFVSDTSGPATLQGITVADQPIWMANDLDNAGTSRDLDRNLIETAWRTARKVDQKPHDTVLGGLIQARKYAMMLVIKDEYTKTDGARGITLDQGYEKLKINNVGLTEDPDCPDDRLYFLHKKDLKIWQLGKPEFIYSPDAKHIWYRIPGKPFFRADGEHFCEFGGYRRNNQTVLRDLTTTG